MRKEYDFTDDLEKIEDLLYLSKGEFLNSYSYLTEKECENTIKKILNYVKTRAKK